ncbi:MAG: hypothetical protein U0132_19175 [Gemmatimonadaceae bacterium]
MRMLSRWIPVLGMVAWLGGAPTAHAQVFGTFPWQMQPYCNVVTLTLTSSPAGFNLDGVDDQCGATNKASAVGVASFNASGNVTLNFSIVTAPSGKPVHVSAVVSPANGTGAWTDSVGNSGTFAFFGATPGLPARPQPTSGLAAATITTVEIAAGAVGGTDINTAEVQARVAGVCPAGQAISAISSNGTVTCAVLPTRYFSAYKTSPAVAANVLFDGTFTKTYAIPEPLITQSVIDSGDVHVWLRVGSINVPLPYVSTAGGSANTIWHKLELGQIRIYRTTHGCTADATCLINLPQSLEYRYSITTGGTVIP